MFNLSLKKLNHKSYPLTENNDAKFMREPKPEKVLFVSLSI